MYKILIVAQKEFRDGLRNRWVLAITLVFALFALALAYFGSAASGQVGFTSLDMTIVSLASLAIFVIPLIALLLAYDTVVGEQEQGTLLLLMSYPLTRIQLLTGKYVGHASVMAVATILGFGLTSILISLATGEITNMKLWRSFLLFTISSVLLGWGFISIAYIISVIVSEKSRAAGVALIVWFVFVLIFDLALLGLLVATEGGINAELFPYLLLLNPTDVFRLANLTGFESTQAYSDLISVSEAKIFTSRLLLSVLAAWALIPFCVAAWLFRRRQA